MQKRARNAVPTRIYCLWTIRETCAKRARRLPSSFSAAIWKRAAVISPILLPPTNKEFPNSSTKKALPIAFSSPKKIRRSWWTTRKKFAKNVPFPPWKATARCSFCAILPTRTPLRKTSCSSSWKSRPKKLFFSWAQPARIPCFPPSFPVRRN